MSTMQSHEAKRIVGGDCDDDVGVLVYRESQIRKAEAAAAERTKKQLSNINSEERRDRMSTEIT